jgi:hypothetical protein
MPSDLFFKMWSVVAFQIGTIEQTIYSAMAASGAVAVSVNIVIVIFWVYAAWKIYEIWIAQANDGFTQKLWLVLTQYRRAMIVYLLVIAAPVLISSLGTVALGFARKGRAAVVLNIPSTMGQIDAVLKTTTAMMPAMGAALETQVAGRSVATLTTAQMGAATVKAAFAPGKNPAMSMGVVNYVAGSVANMAKTFKTNLQNANATQTKASEATGQLTQSASNYMNAQIVAAQATGDTAMVANLQQKIQQMQQAQATGAATPQGPAAMRAVELNTVWMDLQNQWQQDYQNGKKPGADGKAGIMTAGAEMWKTYEEGKAKDPTAAKSALDTKIQAAVNAEMASRDQAKGWAKNLPRIGFEIIGILGMLICAIGVLAAGINIFKAAYGALLYCVGFVAMVVFAVALAKPLSPAFMLCFITDKTEHYGRNFVNFMLGAVFASMGMCMMTTAVSSLFALTSQTLITEGAYRLSVVQLSTGSIGDYLLACLTMAGAMMVAGMAFTFIADFIKKGAAVGAGLFTGHFPH